MRPAPRSARRVALEALARIEDEGAYANVVVPQILGTGSLASRERHFVTELVYGVTRMRRALDARIDAFARGALDPATRRALRLGAYQLGYLRVPAHAAVAETVGLAPLRSRTLVNAVLRRLAGAPEPVWPDDATRLSYPDWIVSRLTADLGRDTALAALEHMNERPFATERDDGYVQDRASQWVADAAVEGLGGRGGVRVLDACAAPGGKATAIAARLAETAGGGGPSLVVAADRRPHRVALLARNVESLAAAGRDRRSDARRSAMRPATVRPSTVTPPAPRRSAGRDAAPRSRAPVPQPAPPAAGSAAMVPIAVVAADALAPPWRTGWADLVLVDAPCSGLGVLHRRPDARWRIQPEDVDQLARLQRALLAACVPLLAPGGRLVYSVCTLTAAETTGIDEWAAAELPELAPMPPPGAPWEAFGRGARLLPQAAGTDGMCLFRYAKITW